MVSGVGILLALSLAATPLPGGEFLLDTLRSFVPAGGSQYTPAVGTDGSSFFVVWRTSSEVAGTRVSSGGLVIDTPGTTIANGSCRDPAVAFNGTDYLAVWRKSHDILARRLSSQGDPIDTTPVIIYHGTGTVRRPRVDSDGNDWLVVWADYRTGSYDVYGARVSAGGTILDTASIPISRRSMTQNDPDLAWNGENYLAVWSDTRSGTQTYAARVTRTGEVLDPAGFPLTFADSTRRYPSVSAARGDWFVVWEDRRRGAGYDLFGTRVSALGLVMDSAGIPISTATGDQGQARVAASGTDYAVVWHDLRSENDIYAARISPDGLVRDPNGIRICAVAGTQETPAMTFAAGNWLVTWSDRRRGRDIYGSRLSPSGVVLDSTGRVLAIGPNEQQEPAVGFDGTNFLAVWSDNREGPRGIYGCRVTPGGTILDRPPVRICTTGLAPAIAFGEANYLVVWTDGRDGVSYDIYGARVAPDGEVLDPGGFPVADGDNEQDYAALAFSGSNYLVVWQEYTEDDGEQVYGARVNRFGTVLDPHGVLISDPGTEEESELPAVAFAADRYFVVWQTFDTLGEAVFGARITRDGARLDPEGILVQHSEVDGIWEPCVASDGTAFLVAWCNSDSLECILARVINLNGVSLESLPSLIGTIGGFAGLSGPALYWADPEYYAVWAQDSIGWDIAGARIGQLGIRTGSFIVTDLPGTQTAPAVAVGNRVPLVVFASYTDTAGGRTYNSYRIWGRLGPFSGVNEPGVGPTAPTGRVRIAPNPARDFVQIRVEPGPGLSFGSPIRLAIYTAAGRRVAELRGVPSAGSNCGYTITWPGEDSRGSRLSPGVYYCRAFFPGSTATARFVWQ